MAPKNGHVLIAQGGGPTPVINSSLLGAVLSMDKRLHSSSRILGSVGGIEGVFRESFLNLRNLDGDNWRLISESPGAALGSCRKKLSHEEAGRAVRILHKHAIRYFVYIGGNDSMDTTLKISAVARDLSYDLRVGGVPKTIDNDLPHTDHCPGYGSAARYIAQSTIDLGTDVRSLPTPVSILEVMGRNAGWLTAATILARQRPDDAPHLVYLPELPLSEDQFLRDVSEVYARQGWVVVVVSEGVRKPNGQSWGLDAGNTGKDDFGHSLQGDVGACLAHRVSSRLKLRARSEKPGLCGRASSLLVSGVDRREAEAAGVFTAEKLLSGESGFMAGLVRTDHEAYAIDFQMVDLKKVANRERLVPSEYISAEGNDVQPHFKDYVTPLIGGPLKHYPLLSDLIR